MGVTSSVQSWVGRRLLARATRGGLDLSALRAVPRPLRFPLQRNGLDPVPALRHQPPVTRLAGLGGMNVWLVTGYDETRAVLADAQSWSNDLRPLVGPSGVIAGLGPTDPPDHTRLRRLLTPEFTRRRLARLQPRIEQIIEDRLDEMAARGPVVDLVSAFAFPVPFQVICELLGLSADDQDRFARFGHARFDVTGGGAGAFGALSYSRQFLLEAAARQRTDPGPGLIGAIVEQHGDEVTDEELGGLADGVFTGGYETSASMLALGTLALLQDPDAFRLVRDDDDAVDTVVEELLRHLSVVQVAFPRFAREVVTLFGHRIAAGDVVVCSLSGANRDAAFGAVPVGFDPHRSGVSHLAFGHGMHRCVGAELARMELRAAFRALTRRFPDLSLAVHPSRLRFRELSIVYGVESLPVRLSRPDPGDPAVRRQPRASRAPIPLNPRYTLTRAITHPGLDRLVQGVSA